MRFGLALAALSIVAPRLAAVAGDKIALGPPPELSVGSTTGDGITVEIGNLRQEGGADSYIEHLDVGSGKIYEVVRVKVTNRSGKTYYPSSLDFELLASDATTYQSWPAHGHTGFADPHGVVRNGESEAVDVAFAVPRSVRPAAILWGTPSLIGDHGNLGETIGARVVMIPDKSGRAVAALAPRGSLGTASQLGITVRIAKPQVVDLPAAVRSRVPDGYVVETLPGTMENNTADVVQFHTGDFVPLDAHALPIAYELRANPAASDILYIKAGKTFSGNLTYIVPANDRPVAIRWHPHGTVESNPGVDEIIMLEH